MTALAGYEYLITLDRELSYIWTKETSLTIKITFFVNRYVGLAYACLSALSDIVVHVSNAVPLNKIV